MAAVLLPRDGFLELARRELHGAGYALERDAPDDWRWTWRRRRGAVVSLAAALDIAEAEVLAPPPRRDLSAAACCPQCGGEYLESAAECEACGMPLVPFPAPTGRR